MEVPLGEMGESIEEATVQSFEKQVGEWVDQDEIVINMESEKGDAQVRTPEAGVIVEFKFEEGDDAEVGNVMFVVDTSAEKPAGGAPAQPAAQAEAPKEEKQEAQKPAQTQAAPAQKAPPAPKAPTDGKAKQADDALAGQGTSLALFY